VKLFLELRLQNVSNHHHGKNDQKIHNFNVANVGIKASGGSAMVDHSATHLEIGGSNPAFHWHSEEKSKGLTDFTLSHS
jgi:hypothetical protein